MAQRAGRITCPKCGANNFDTVTSCWKCGAPVGAGAPVAAAVPIPAAPAYSERMPPQPQPIAYAPSASPAIPAGDSRVARRAAIALALTIPWIGLPVGWIFMMIEDSRKQAVGRVCAAWSMIALVLHLALMGWMTQASINYLINHLGPLINAMQRTQGGGGMEGGGNYNVP
jgi:hypothetical protein